MHTHIQLVMNGCKYLHTYTDIHAHTHIQLEEKGCKYFLIHTCTHIHSVWQNVNPYTHMHANTHVQLVIEGRNYTGIMLMDRNDELCILYEKSNIQVCF